MLSNIYGKATIREGMCREWFQCFMKKDFVVEGWQSGGRDKIIEDAHLESLIDKDSC